MYSRFMYTATVIFLTLFGTSALYAQMTASQVLNNMLETHERGIQNIDDYTVVTDMYTAQYKKTYVDGRPVFKSRVQVRGMEQFDGQAASSSTMGHSELFDDNIFRYLKQSARYEGTETIDGIRTHVLFVADLEPIAEPGETDHPKNAYLYVDADKWVMSKMKFDVEVEMEPGQKQMMQPVIRFLDYRSVEGMLLPFKTVMELGDMDAAISPEEREEAREAMAEMKRELEQMPEQQRQMVENMMRPQLEQYEKMLEGDAFEIVIEVQEVQVNTGLSDDLFN